MSLRELVLVRHGESIGNVARDAALAADVDVIGIDIRDADVPLSARGVDQAQALGGVLREGLPPGATIWTSPYRRAQDTAAVALAAAGIDTPVRVDDRLRDRELGVLDLLTARGVERRFPDEAVRRRFLGKLYYRPPGGESWADVALRLRSFLAALEAGPARTALVSTHDAVIVLFRYVLENLSEEHLMELAQRSVANASLTRLVRDGADGAWRAVEFDSSDHVSAPVESPEHLARPTR